MELSTFKYNNFQNWKVWSKMSKSNIIFFWKLLFYSLFHSMIRTARRSHYVTRAYLRMVLTDQFFSDKKFAEITMCIKIVWKLILEGLNEYIINISSFFFYLYRIIEAIFNLWIRVCQRKASPLKPFFSAKKKLDIF